MDRYTLAECTLSDCAFYSPDPGSSRMCRCLHPEKPNYAEGRCPLYKLDWQKASRLNAAKLNAAKPKLPRPKPLRPARKR